MDEKQGGYPSRHMSWWESSNLQLYGLTIAALKGALGTEDERFDQ